jgi:hypothetical protein
MEKQTNNKRERETQRKGNRDTDTQMREGDR